MEKIRSGQSFLYREGGLNSTVIDVRMTENVRGSFLNQALIQALTRYPYLTAKLVEKDGDYYFERDDISIIAVKTDKLRVLSSLGTGYHLLDITFTANKICVAFHHALCDGRGIKPFVETLIYYYCCLRYHKELDSTGIRLAEEALLPGETEEPVGYDYHEFDKSKLPVVSKDGFALPENEAPVTDYYRTEINLNQQQFIRYAKKHNATPAILLALLVSCSIKKLHSDADKPIICSMATDYRHEIGMNNTHKNCVGSIYLPYSNEIEGLSLLEQAKMYRSIMKSQKNPDAVKAAVNAQVGLYNKLDTLHTLAEKKQMMAFFNDMCIDTYVISYLGQFQLDSCAEYIESMHLYNSGVPGLRINMISVGDCISVDILQSYDSDDLISELLAALDETGIEYTASERKPFQTVKDKAYITASRQAERYYA